jgi:hypothetical protein
MVEPLPVAALYLDGYTLHFLCLDAPVCFPDVDLTDAIDVGDQPGQHPLAPISAYYGRDSSVWVFLSGSIWNYLAKIDLRTSQAQVLDLNAPALSTNNGVPMFLPGTGKMIHGRIVVATTDGKLGIVQDDLSLRVIDLKNPLFDLIEVDDTELAALSTSRFRAGKLELTVFIVDVETGESQERKLDTPVARGEIVTLSQDLGRVYSIDSDVLSVYDMNTQAMLLSAPISRDESITYSSLTSARYQYHDAWYYSRPGVFFEGLVPAMLLDMLTLEPIVDPDELLAGEQSAEFVIAPFGDHFLIGLNSRVLLVSLAGSIENAFPLSAEIVGRSYLLVEDRNQGVK